jgi:DNA-binding XRE family transcriptional regulator
VSDSENLSDVTPESDGRSLRDVRAERLLSMRELARLADVTPNTIYRIEAGRSTPQLSVARRIAEALSVDALAITEFRQAIRVHGGLR